MPRFDCQACGACCCNTRRNLASGNTDYIEIEKSDVLFREHRDLLKQIATRNDDGAWFMKLVGDEQRCANLEGDVGEGVGCGIYKLRPSGCKRVEAGDEECLAARRLHLFKAV